MNFQGMSRDRAAEVLLCAAQTPSVEMHARSGRLSRNRDRDAKTHGAHGVALDAFEERERAFGQRILAFVTANGYTGPQPDFEAMLAEG